MGIITFKIEGKKTNNMLGEQRAITNTNKENKL